MQPKRPGARPPWTHERQAPSRASPCADGHSQVLAQRAVGGRASRCEPERQARSSPARTARHIRRNRFSIRRRRIRPKPLAAGAFPPPGRPAPCPCRSCVSPGEMRRVTVGDGQVGLVDLDSCPSRRSRSGRPSPGETDAAWSRRSGSSPKPEHPLQAESARRPASGWSGTRPRPASTRQRRAGLVEDGAGGHRCFGGRMRGTSERPRLGAVRGACDTAQAGQIKFLRPAQPLRDRPGTASSADRTSPGMRSSCAGSLTRLGHVAICWISIQ